MNARPKPKVFVASSVEGLDIAYAIQSNLEHDADVTPWPQGTFDLGQFPMESLINAVQKSDFGVFVFAYEDITKLRGEDVRTTRDNVLLELGMFLGSLGRERSYIIMPRTQEPLHVPTDLLGLTPARFNPDRSDGNLLAALGPACNQIRQAIRKHGLRNAAGTGTGMLKRSPKTPPDRILSGLVNGALESVCRAVSVPMTPESAKLRVFIFKKIGSELVCTHFWSPNPVKEVVNKLRFNMDGDDAEHLVVTRAVTSQSITREDVDANRQRKLADQAQVSGELKFVLAAPIFRDDGSSWGVVDFDSSSEEGKKLLNTEVSDATMFRLSKHLELIFSLQESEKE